MVYDSGYKTNCIEEWDTQITHLQNSLALIYIFTEFVVFRWLGLFTVWNVKT